MRSIVPVIGPITKQQTVFHLITVVGMAMVIFHMAVSQFIFTSTETFLTLHLTFALFLVFLTKLETTRSHLKNGALVVALIATSVCAAYIIINVDSLRMNAWFNSRPDLIIGVILLILSFSGAVIAYGWFIPMLVLLVMIYPFFGHHLPQPFTTYSLSIEKVISNMSIGLKTGLFETTLSISANFIFLFCVFGGLLGVTGVQTFFFELGKLLVGKFRSGPALMAVVNSAFVGSVVGSAVANVSITGQYTIPAMKKAGYTPEQAAAVESVASNGGQILPPVMGIMAFAMAGYSGISYWKICKMALVPAIIYYAILILYCQLHALKNPVLRKRVLEKQTLDLKIIRYKSAAFVLPLGVIIYLFAQGYSVMNVAFWAILTVLVVNIFQPRELRPKIGQIVTGFCEGAITGAKLAIICAIIGCLVTTFTTSGLSIKITSGIEVWSRGSLLLALFILWAGTIIAGMVGVSVAAYFTAAAFAVPVMQKLGVPYDISHFFLSYPAAFALLTPPVALVSLVAAQIANSDYNKTAVESTKVAVTAFLLPFLFVYAPALLLIGDSLSMSFWLDITIIFLGFAAMQIFFVGFFISPLSLPETIALAVSSLALLLYPILRSPYLPIIGMVLFLIVIAAQLLKAKLKREQAMAGAPLE